MSFADISSLAFEDAKTPTIKKAVQLYFKEGSMDSERNGSARMPVRAFSET